MAWLRLDDKFAEHRKLLRLRRGDRWTWLELLLYCSRQRNATVTRSVTEILKYVTPAFLMRCEEAGLLDPNPDGSSSWVVHDWDIYNPADPTAADRMKRLRQRQQSEEERNDNRNADRNIDRNENRNVTDPRAQPRARVPSPSPETPLPPFQENDKVKGRVKRTGYRLVRGTHGISYVRDPDGTDRLPAGYQG